MLETVILGTRPREAGVSVLKVPDRAGYSDELGGYGEDLASCV